MERLRKSLLVILFMLFLSAAVPRGTRAVVGELNNGLATPTPQTIIVAPDEEALKKCNQKNEQLQQELTGCQKAAVVEVKTDAESDATEHLYLFWAIGSTAVAAVLGVILLIRFLKKTPPSSTEPNIPPFTS